MNKLLSICIPTYNRKDFIDRLLESIYSQNADESLYELCITDDSDGDETEKLIKEKYARYCNLRYQKVPNTGYMNLIKALQFGDAPLLKLHNDYSIFCKNSLNDLIEVIRNQKELDGVLFFRGDGKNKSSDLKKFDNFNSFMREVGIASTWSTSFVIQKSDLDEYINSNQSFNSYFPHVSLLFSLTDRKSYTVDDKTYYENINLEKKGGYNIPEVFFGDYLHMVYALRDKGYVTDDTVQYIKGDIINFASYWKARTKCYEGITYDFEGDKEIIIKECGKAKKIQYNLLYAMRVIKYRLKK